MTEARLFSLHRHEDETGVSGTGRVMEGVVFHTGEVVVCWRTDVTRPGVGFSSLAIYEDWLAFASVHLESHPGRSSVVFEDGGGPPDAG